MKYLIFFKYFGNLTNEYTDSMSVRAYSQYEFVCDVRVDITVR